MQQGLPLFEEYSLNFLWIFIYFVWKIWVINIFLFKEFQKYVPQLNGIKNDFWNILIYVWLKCDLKISFYHQYWKIYFSSLVNYVPYIEISVKLKNMDQKKKMWKIFIADLENLFCIQQENPFIIFLNHYYLSNIFKYIRSNLGTSNIFLRKNLKIPIIFSNAHKKKIIKKNRIIHQIIFQWDKKEHLYFNLILIFFFDKIKWCRN